MLPATPIILLGEPLVELSSVDSTNIYAMEQIKQGLAYSGSCYRADYQTGGKGQHGRVWESNPGENLLCTYVLDLKQVKSDQNWTPADQNGLSAAVAMGVHQFFSHVAGSPASIKLPNDLYWNDRKAGGILIENSIRGTQWTWTIIGIGININQINFTAGAGNPISLQQITGKHWDLQELQIKLAAALSNTLNEWLQKGAKTVEENLKEVLIKIK